MSQAKFISILHFVKKYISYEPRHNYKILPNHAAFFDKSKYFTVVQYMNKANDFGSQSIQASFFQGR